MQTHRVLRFDVVNGQNNDDRQLQPTLAENLSMVTWFEKKWRLDQACFHSWYYPLNNFIIYISFLMISPYSRISAGISLGLDIVLSFMLGGLKSEKFYIFNIDRLNPDRAPGAILLMVLLDYALLYARALAVFMIGGAITAYTLPKFTSYSDIQVFLFTFTLTESIWYGACELYGNGPAISKSICNLPCSMFRAARIENAALAPDPEAAADAIESNAAESAANDRKQHQQSPVVLR